MRLSVYAFKLGRDDTVARPITVLGQPVDFAQSVDVSPEVCHALTGAFADSVNPRGSVTPVVTPGLGDNIIRQVDIGALPNNALHLYSVDQAELDFRMAEAGYGHVDVQGVISYGDFLSLKQTGKPPNCYAIEALPNAITLEEDHPLLTAMERSHCIEEVPVELKSNSDINTSHWVNTTSLIQREPSSARLLFNSAPPAKKLIPLNILTKWSYFLDPRMASYKSLIGAVKEMYSGGAWETIISVCLHPER